MLGIGCPSIYPHLPVGEVVFESLLALLNQGLLIGIDVIRGTLGHIILRDDRPTWETLLDWQDRQLGAGESLVPVGSGGPIIPKMVTVTGLHGNLDLLGEADGIRKMPSVRDLGVRNIVFVNDRTSKAEGILLHAPALREVILATSAMEGRGPYVVVDKDHIVTLTPPCLTVSTAHRTCGLTPWKWLTD